MALVFFAFALPLLVVRKFFGKVIQCMEDKKWVTLEEEYVILSVSTSEYCCEYHHAYHTQTRGERHRTETQ